MSNPSTIEALCLRLGIDLAYTDAFGHAREVPQATLRALCAAMGVAPDDEAAARRAIAAIDARQWSHPLPPACVARIDDDGAVELPLCLPADAAGRPLRWRLTLEDGSARGGTVVPDALPVRQTGWLDGRAQRRWGWRLENVPAGYHRLELLPEPRGEPAGSGAQGSGPAVGEAATLKASTDGPATDGSATAGPATDGSATGEAATGEAATDEAATDEAATEKAATDEAATDRTAIMGEARGAAVRLIACPPACLRPDDIVPGLRVWGPALQLYAVRSARNWGIGDFGDLSRAVDLAAAAGAGLVGLNPLHALFADAPAAASPYSPSNRSWLNPLYLDIERLDEFAGCDAARAHVASPAFAARLDALRAADFVDYPGVAATKFEVLELMWRWFVEHQVAHGSPQAAAFATFREQGGAALRAHALFEAVQAHRRRLDPQAWGWPVWPVAWRDVGSAEVAAFEREHADRIGYHAWLQWLCERQLAEVAGQARALGMPIGLYRDLAVGVASGGSETWAHPGLYALGARVGAPPDELNLQGQDWGLPPMIPSRLVAAGYQPFIDLLRANMRHAGALRIDHVMGLMRLFWVPPGAQPTEGAYVHYPLRDLAGIVALESRRNRCLVVGEDLGTVPDAVRETMGTHGMLSYRPLYFERDAGGAFRAPGAVQAAALVALGTHDLPTLRGFWRGADIATRDALGLFPSDALRERTLRARAQDRAQLLLALQREGLLPPGTALDPQATPEPDDALVAAVHAYLARMPAGLLAFQLEDAFGQLEQVNLPGTTEAAYPNWRRKLPVPLEQWSRAGRLLQVAAALVAGRGAAPRVKP